MLQNGMSRLFFPALVAWGLALAGAAQAQPVRGLIVQLKPAAADAQGVPSERAQALRERIAAVVQDTGLALHSQRPLGNQLQALRLAQPPSAEALDAAMRRLRLHPDVAAVVPDELLKRQDTQPNDPGYARQWHLQAPASGGAAAINLPPAWDLSTGNGNITVAVLDTGIVKTHPDLAGRFWDGYDFVSEVEFANDGDGRDADASDPGDWITGADANSAVFAGCDVASSSWHGTFIAGQIAAATNNNLGVSGINWGNKVLPVRVSGKCGAFLSDVLDGLRWAAGLPVSGVPANPHPARVINLSFGGSAACDSVYQTVIDDITAAGALLVVAGGNNNGPLTRPADCRNVLSVGAVQQDGLKATYSSYGPGLGLMAPGGSGADGATQIYSTTNAGLQGPAGDVYGTKLGSSFSTPLAAGVASLMLSLNPALKPTELIARLQAAARPHLQLPGRPSCVIGAPTSLACNCSTATCGPGLLNAFDALRLAVNPAAPLTPAPTTPVSDDGGGGGGALGWLWGLGLWGLAGWAALKRRRA